MCRVNTVLFVTHCCQSKQGYFLGLIRLCIDLFPLFLFSILLPSIDNIMSVFSMDSLILVYFGFSLYVHVGSVCVSLGF